MGQYGSWRGFERFLSEQDSALQKISRFSRCSHTVEELHSEAWIVAYEIQERRDQAIDFGEASEQQLVLDGLRRRLAAAGRSRFGTLSIDQGSGEDSERPSLLWFLAAADDSDPLVFLEKSRESVDWRAIAAASYSEIAAYILLLVRVDWDRIAIAACLRISTDVLLRKLKSAGDLARRQPSLFDGVDSIDPDFVPRQHKIRIRPSMSENCVEQLRWE